MSDTHVSRVAALFEQVAPGYDQHVPFFSAFARRLVVWTGVRPGDRLLDIGTGRGAVADAARSGGATVVALDIAEAMLRHGRGPRVRGDARALPFRMAAFDIAVSAFSIHLLPDPVAGLRDAARCVRPNGRVVLAYGGRFTSSDWDFWFEILGRHADRGTREPTLPPLTPIEDHHAAFRGAGLSDVRAVEAEIAVPIQEPQACLLGEQAHGARSFFDRFEPDVRRQVEAELLAELEARHRRGGLMLRRASWFVEGRKP